MECSPEPTSFVCSPDHADKTFETVVFLGHIFIHTRRTKDFPLKMDSVSKENIFAMTTASLSVFTTTISHQNFFIFLFIWRYFRLIVHMLSFWLYKPIPVPDAPTVLRSDCTVVVPISDPGSKDPKFKECLTTILANNPAAVIVTTVGKDKLAICKSIIAPINAAHGNKIRVIQQSKGNKRIQVCHAIPHVKTPIVIGVDATVFWPSTDFLPAILAPFEDPKVGVVGTYKRVVREPTGFNFKSFWNFIGCLYLERHNFEVAATSNIDGGAFVISGRTAAYRREIFADAAFQRGFTNERFFFGLFGPLNPDDDNFITRWVVRHGWKVKFQYSEDAMIKTRVGTYPRYLSQCLRWARTTWRSNSASLFTDPFRRRTGLNNVWVQQPWCVYAVYLTSFTNFALFTDAALLYSVTRTSFAGKYGLPFTVTCMAAWIFATKLVKPWPHFRRNSADLLFLPGYILFGYYHSLLKLYALLTFWNCVWGGREVKDAEPDVNADDDDDDDDDDFPSPADTMNQDDGFNFYGRSPRIAGVALRNVGARYRWTAPTTNIIRTPWGAVKTFSAHLTPANVLESQIPGCVGTLRGGGAPVKATISRSSTTPVKSSPTSGKSRIHPKRYEWTRGSNCERLHSEKSNLLPVKQRCVLGTPSGYTGSPRK